MKKQQSSSQRVQLTWWQILIGFIIIVIIVTGRAQIVSKLIRKNNQSDHPLFIPTKIPSPLPTSAGDQSSEFYSPATNTTKQIKVYEIVIENSTISTNTIVKDREHDIYFVNKDSSAYSLEIYKDDLLIESTALSPRQVYSIALAEVGSYSFKILENVTVKFEGKIYVQ